VDNSTRQKYLNALIKTINNIDDTVFSQRVNASRNDYAEWIKKNLADEELAKSVSSIYDKNRFVEVLKQASLQSSMQSNVQTGKDVQQSFQQSLQNAASNMSNISSANASNATSVQSSTPSSTQLSLSHSQSLASNLQSSVAASNVPSSTSLSSQTSTISTSVIPVPNVDNVQRSKYLGALIKTINALNDDVFKQRVNAASNQYADWVLKNMHDQELYSKLKQVNDKTKMVELLSTELSIASKPKPTLTQVVQAASQAAQAAAPVSQVSLTPAPVSSSAVSAPTSIIAALQTPQVSKKKVDNATESKYLNALIKTINGLSNEVFLSRVNSSKNEYADWVLKNIGDEALYTSLKEHPDRNSLVNVLQSNVQLLKSVPAPAQIVTPAPVSIAPAPKISKVSEEIPSTNEPILIKTTSTASSTSESGADQKLSAQDLFKKLKQSRDSRIASGRPALKLKPVHAGVAVKNYNQDIDLIKMSARQIIEKLRLIDYSQQNIAVEEDVSIVKKQIKRIKTGVPGFDEMIGAGIPSGSVVLTSGGPGSGKTTFCIQMLGWAAERGEKCLFISLEENSERLIEHMESYGLNPRKYLAEGTLVIQQQDPFKISRSIEALLAHGRGELLIDIESIMDIIPKGFKPDRVVIDSLSAIASAFNESNTAYRIYVSQLVNLLSKTGATSFLVTEVQGIENIGHGLVEEFLADGVIVFYNMQRGNIKQSALEILKMRSVNHEKKIVPFEFVDGKGIVVYPLEKIFV